MYPSYTFENTIGTEIYGSSVQTVVLRLQASPPSFIIHHFLLTLHPTLSSCIPKPVLLHPPQKRNYYLYCGCSLRFGKTYKILNSHLIPHSLYTFPFSGQRMENGVVLSGTVRSSVQHKLDTATYHLITTKHLSAEAAQWPPHRSRK